MPASENTKGWAAGLAVACLLLSGCPRPQSVGPEPRKTPTPVLAPPVVEIRANPVSRLIVAGRSADDAARLMVLSLRIENIHDEPLAIRPESIYLELPSGISLAAFDHPRARAIVERTTVARADRYYLRRGTNPPPGGLSAVEKRAWRDQIRDRLLDRVELAPRESTEGFVVIDTKRRYRSLGDAIVEVVASPTTAEPGRTARYPVRVYLGASTELETGT